ncbi:MAG: XRE family transcriptional regulator [Bryobacterales bacterium]|nr:XRE family transcriptional regulator [Bryobacterales bacterium]
MPKIAPTPPAHDTHSDQARATLTNAVLRAAHILEITQAELAALLGLSPATVSRMAAGRYFLQPNAKEWQLAALFVRLFRSLDTITGGNDDLSRRWLRGPNLALSAVPATLLADVAGLVMVVQYLDAARAVN